MNAVCILGLHTHTHTYWTHLEETVFHQAAVISILLYRCTTWTLTKWMEKKLDSNYTRML